MANELQVMGVHEAGASSLLKGARPITNAKLEERAKRGDNKWFPKIMTPRDMMVNSLLRRDEWDRLDTRVMQAVLQPLNLTRVLIQRGLVTTLGSIGVLQASYTRIGEMTAANASLRGHASTEKDLVDSDIKAIPVPIISKEFELDARTLASSRMQGNAIDVTNGAAAGRVVAEKVEDLVINGDSSINLNGATIYGLTNHPDRNTDTAANYGGGDWGTITNVTPTIAGAIANLQADGFYGPYGIFAHTVQYHQAATAFFTDGSVSTPLARSMLIPGVELFEPSAQLDAGEVIVLHLSEEVIEIAYVESYWPVTNLEWTSGDGMQLMFKVMTVMTPLIKSGFGAKSGIVHVTSA